MRLIALAILVVTLVHCSFARHLRGLQEQGETIDVGSGDETLNSVDDTNQLFAAPGGDWQQQVLTLVNQERAKVGLSALCLNSKLNAAAQGHADDMATKNYFSHTSRDGRDPFTRMKQQGYAAAGGENIAAGQTTAQQVVNVWMSDKGHRDNILGKSFKHMGVGLGYTTSSQYKYYWVQDFGSSTTEQCTSGPPTNPPTTRPPTNPPTTSPPTNPPTTNPPTNPPTTDPPTDPPTNEPTTAPPDSDWQKQLLTLVNQERSKVGLPSLCLNAKLNAAAQGHADDMATNNYFDHYSQDGTDPFTRMKRQGYAAASAENIAAGQTTPQEVMDAWMGDQGHRDNILGRGFKHMGVGKGYNTNSDYTYYWVQDFGSSTTEPCLSGPPTNPPTTQPPTNPPTTNPPTNPPTTSPPTNPPTTKPPTNPPTTNPPTTKPTTAPPSSDWQQQLLTLVNQERAKVGLPALCLNAKLNAAAQGHATDMATKNYFSHTSLDGRDPFTRMKQQGYTGGSAENIAAGQTTPQDVMNTWMNSPGHRANILSNARQLGVGKAYNAGSTYRYYWVQNFGTSSTEPCLSS